MEVPLNPPIPWGHSGFQFPRMLLSFGALGHRMGWAMDGVGVPLNCPIPSDLGY